MNKDHTATWMAAMAVDSLRKQGQDLYRQKAYEGALRCFDKVSPAQHVPGMYSTQADPL